MTTTIGLRDLARQTNLLDNYDYVDVEDKKTHEYKGLYVSPKYADELKAYLEQKINAEKQEELDAMMQFAGILDGETGDMSAKEIKSSKKDKYSDA